VESQEVSTTDLPVDAVRYRRSVLLGLASVACVGILTVFYARIGRVVPLDSDNANGVLEAADMLRGNLILRGWWLSGDNFLTTDLPLYAAGVAIFGVSPRTARYVGAAVYALTVGLVVLLARRRGSEPGGWLRMLIAFGLTAVPAAGIEVQSVLRGPYHITTTLFLLVCFWLIDRWESRWTAVVVFVLLTLTQAGDPLALVLGALPMIVVTGLRAARRRGGWDGQLLLAALGSVLGARLLPALINGLHGFSTIPLAPAFISFDDLAKHTLLILHLTLLTFGADFFGLGLGRTAAQPLVRAVALLFVAAVTWTVFRRWRQGHELEPAEGEGRRVSELLVAGLLLFMAALLFSDQAGDLGGIRYMAPVLFFGAALAGREGIRLFLRSGPQQLLAAGVALLLLSAGWSTYKAAPVPDRPTALVPWLERHGLREGLAGYWEASSVTLESKDQVRVRGIAPVGQRFGPFRWASKAEWYDPSRHDARFVLIDGRAAGALNKGSVESAFGTPSQEAEVDGYVILTYDRNLLQDPGWAAG